MARPENGEQERVPKPLPTMPGAGSEDSLRIVVLCTGNQFRSPLAAALLDRFGKHQSLEVTSCGLGAREDLPALREAVARAQRLGLDLRGHRSRSALRKELEQADLVLGFERWHVARAVVDFGAALDRSFTMPEAVDLLRKVPTDASGTTAEARRMIAAAHELRTSRRSWRIAPELRDPMGGSPKVFDETAKSLRALTRELVARLFAIGADGEPAPARLSAPVGPGRGSRRGWRRGR